MVPAPRVVVMGVAKELPPDLRPGWNPVQQSRATGHMGDLVAAPLLEDVDLGCLAGAFMTRRVGRVGSLPAFPSNSYRI